MRTLLALGAALSLATAALPARADGPGDLQARAYGLFDQATWTSVWSNSLIGSGCNASTTASARNAAGTQRARTIVVVEGEG